MTRLEGWDDRLAEVIAGAVGRAYVLGEHDCLRVACATVQALTGEDFWPRFAGYKTKREALVAIARVAPSLPEAVSKVLGIEPVTPRLARRGDVCHYQDGEDHLGVCIGEHVAILGPDGLLLVPITDDRVPCCWRIG